MTTEDLSDISIGQFINKIFGFYEWEKEQQEQEWERTNYQIYSALLLSPDIKTIEKPKTFEEFKSVKKKAVKQLTTDQVKKLLQLQ